MIYYVDCLDDEDNFYELSK